MGREMGKARVIPCPSGSRLSLAKCFAMHGLTKSTFMTAGGGKVTGEGATTQRAPDLPKSLKRKGENGTQTPVI